MKPLGIITMCFPHVDDETREILQSVMEEAENFGDFTERLCNKVCSESTTPLAEYFAWYFATKSDALSILDKLEQAGRIPELAEPLLLSLKYRRGEIVTWDEMKQSLLRALNAAPTDWIASHLYMKWRLLAESFFPECDTDVKPIDIISKKVSTDEDLEYFISYLLRIQAAKFRREGNLQGAFEADNKALALARKYDDQIMVADLLCTVANKVKFTDTKQAINLLVSAREIGEQLGYKGGLAEIQHQLCHIMGHRGELDAAIERQLECRSIILTVEMSESIMGFPNLGDSITAFYYNYSGNGEKALEFAESGIRASASRKRAASYACAQKAWALTNLGRYEEARDYLEESKMLAMKSGSIDNIVITQIVDGILDKAEENYDSAVYNFEEALKAQEDAPLGIFHIICLLNLVEIEIEKLPSNSIDINADSSGPWMKKLDENTQENDLPGIAAWSLILKASLRRKQGRHDEVRNLLKEVLKAAESPSMRYLKDLVVSTFPDVIVS